MSTAPLFNKLGTNFQAKVLQALLTDRSWSAQFIEVFNVDECLEPVYLKLIASKFINYYHSYKEFPTMDLLITIIKDDLLFVNNVRPFFKRSSETKTAMTCRGSKKKPLPFVASNFSRRHCHNPLILSLQTSMKLLSIS